MKFHSFWRFFNSTVSWKKISPQETRLKWNSHSKELIEKTLQYDRRYWKLKCYFILVKSNMKSYVTVKNTTLLENEIVSYIYMNFFSRILLCWVKSCCTSRVSSLTRYNLKKKVNVDPFSIQPQNIIFTQIYYLMKNYNLMAWPGAQVLFKELKSIK